MMVRKTPNQYHSIIDISYPHIDAFMYPFLFPCGEAGLRMCTQMRDGKQLAAEVLQVFISCTRSNKNVQ